MFYFKCPLFLARHEHSPRGDHSAPLRHACLRALADHQPGGDGLRQRGKGQSRGGPSDWQAASGAAGEAGLHHGDQDRAQQQLRLTDDMLVRSYVLAIWYGRWRPQVVMVNIKCYRAKENST